MAVTCRRIIIRALRKINVIGAGVATSADIATDALGSLQSIYLELVSGGAFGRMNDVIVPEGTTSYNANEFERVNCQDSTGVDVYLPDVITTDPTVIHPDGTTDYGFGESVLPRPPVDGAIIQVTDLFSDLSSLFIYDADLQRWVSVKDMELGTAAPLGVRYGEGLACKLAAIIAPEFSRPVPPSVVAGITAFHTAISSKRDSASRVVSGTYF